MEEKPRTYVHHPNSNSKCITWHPMHFEFNLWAPCPGGRVLLGVSKHDAFKFIIEGRFYNGAVEIILMQQ